MKILLLNYEFPPMGGGASNATYNIAKELVSLGHSVDVLTSKLKSQPSEEYIHGFRVYRVFSWRKGIHDCGMRGAYTYVWNAAFKLTRHLKANKYNILHYFFSLPTGLLSLVPGVYSSTPYIVSLRGSDVPGYDNYNKKLLLFHFLLKPVTRHIWKKAYKVIALSNGLKETALKTAPNQAMEIIGNGVETDIFKPDAQNYTNDNMFKLIAVTRLIERKGVQHVIEALHELQDNTLKLTVVGTGHFEKKLKKLVYNYGLNDQVFFLGYCTREELPKLYNQSDVFILSSMAESFGIVFAEAMSCKLPVIGGRVGGVPDLIKKENGILISPGNIQEIKDAITHLKDNFEPRKQMGELNRQRVCEHYSWRSVAQRYLRYYEEAQGT